MSHPRWEVRLGSSEFVDYDLESQQRLERAMQAGEVQLQLLLAGRAFTVTWTRASADDCWEILMRSDRHPERTRPVRRHPPRAAPAPERARAVEPAVKGDWPDACNRRDPHDEREQRHDDAKRSDGSGRGRLGGAGERSGGTVSGGAAAEVDEADEPAPLRRRHLATEPDEVEQLGKDKVRLVLLRAPLGLTAPQLA